MTESTTTPRTELRVERMLPAAPQAVFEAWTTPGLMAGWLSPTGSAEVEADVRVGGAFRVTMIGEDGTRLDHRGEYLTIDPPRRLAFTWQSPFTGDQPSVVTVVLEPQGEQTRLVLTHEQLPAAAVDSHEGGWRAILDHLASHLQSGSAALA